MLLLLLCETVIPLSLVTLLRVEQTSKKAQRLRSMLTAILVHLTTLNAEPPVTGCVSSLPPLFGTHGNGCNGPFGSIIVIISILGAHVYHLHAALFVLIGLLLVEQLRIDAVIGLVITKIAQVHLAIQLFLLGRLLSVGCRDPKRRKVVTEWLGRVAKAIVPMARVMAAALRLLGIHFAHAGGIAHSLAIAASASSRLAAILSSLTSQEGLGVLIPRWGFLYLDEVGVLGVLHPKADGHLGIFRT